MHEHVFVAAPDRQELMKEVLRNFLADAKANGLTHGETLAAETTLIAFAVIQHGLSPTQLVDMVTLQMASISESLPLPEPMLQMIRAVARKAAEEMAGGNSPEAPKGGVQ